jgi:type I restriction enzyme R subunit
LSPFNQAPGIDHCAVEEYPTTTGPADYVLFYKGQALACVEGKKIGIGPQNVLQQARRYARGFPAGMHSFGDYHLPFVYSTASSHGHRHRENIHYHQFDLPLVLLPKSRRDGWP